MITFILFLFIVGQIADVWTTKRVLDNGGTELNPVVAWIMERFGGEWVLLKLAASIGIGALLWGYGETLALGIFTAIVWAVAFWNWRQI